MEFIAETYTPQTPWRDVPILKVKKRIQSVNCTFERHAYPSGGYVWYLVATRRRKQVVGRRIQMVELQIEGNSLWGQTERYETLKLGELPEYQWFEHVFNDFCMSIGERMRKFL